MPRSTTARLSASTVDEETRTINAGFQCSHSMMVELRARALLEERSVSAVIRTALRQYLRSVPGTVHPPAIVHAVDLTD